MRRAGSTSDGERRGGATKGRTGETRCFLLFSLSLPRTGDVKGAVAQGHTGICVSDVIIARQRALGGGESHKGREKTLQNSRPHRCVSPSLLLSRRRRCASASASLSSRTVLSVCPLLCRLSALRCDDDGDKMTVLLDRCWLTSYPSSLSLLPLALFLARLCPHASSQTLTMRF